MNIGILYPRSKAHPGLGFDFLDGLKTFLKQQELTGKIHFTTESIGFGGSEKEVYEKAEKLLMIDGVDVLLAYIDQRVMGILQPLFYASGKLIVIINPGANYPLNWIPQKNTVNLTLQHAFLCWLSGGLAAEPAGKNAAVATTYFDCGYLHTTAMVKNYVRNGGTIRHNYVNNQLYNDSFDIKQLAHFLSADKDTGNLLCVFDSLPGFLFYNRLDQLEDSGRLKLFVSPMMLEQQALAGQDQGFNFSIEGYATWLPSFDNEPNKIFMDYYRQQTKRAATIFSLLGWEAGMILQQVLMSANEDYADGAAIAEQLTAIKLNSPRGEMKLDAATQYYIAAPAECSIEKHSAEIKTSQVGDHEKEWEAFVAEPTEGVISGWMNTYLCY